MFAIILIVGILISPELLWYYGYTEIAVLWGIYVLFTIPSIIIIIRLCIKNKCLPKIIDGPSFGLHTKKL